VLGAPPCSSQRNPLEFQLRSLVYFAIPSCSFSISSEAPCSRATPAQSEYVTRKKLVDRKLKDAGWGVIGFDPSKSLQAFDWCAIEEFPTESGPADYALCVGGRILGVVEGKKLSVGPQEVLRLAERYSKGVIANPLDFRGYKVPFLYSTNGESIRFLDVRRVEALFKLADVIEPSRTN